MNAMEDQDIVQEILLRLPPKSLGRCKSLSKAWYSFISYNPAFRNNYRSRNKGRCYLMMGIFFTKTFCHAEKDDDVMFIRTCTRGKPVTAINKKRTRNDDPRTAPTPPIDGKLSFLGHCNINVLASSNGALLVSTESLRPVNYFICNPIMKQHITLPTTRPITGHCTHGFICSTGYPDFRKGFEYKIVRGTDECHPRSSGTTVYLDILSSECPDKWRSIDMNFEIPLYLNNDSPTIISEQGLIYMIGVVESQKDRRLVKVDASKRETEVSLTELPDEKLEAMSYKFGQSNQLILYAVYTPTHINIWGLNERNDGTRKWTLKHILGSEIWRLIQPCEAVTVAAFHPTNPNIVFCYVFARTYLYGIHYSYRKKMSYDFGNSTWEQTCNRYDQQNWKYTHRSFPYTCDAVFAPHLLFDT